LNENYNLIKILLTIYTYQEYATIKNILKKTNTQMCPTIWLHKISQEYVIAKSKQNNSIIAQLDILVQNYSSLSRSLKAKF